MNLLSKYEITGLLLSIAVMLGLGKIFGEFFRRLRLPSVIGELIAGIVLGPTLLGRVAPELYQWIFPTSTRGAVALEALVLMGVIFLLLIAGLEVDLSSVFKQGRTVAWTSFFNIIIPFGLGVMLPLALPLLFPGSKNPLLVSLFIGVALAITALPVIAKILLDMNLFHSDFGMLVLASAMINDLFGWLFFSVIIQIASTGALDAVSLLKTAALTVIFAFTILTLLRYVISFMLPWVQAKTEWPGGVLVFIITIGFLCSALTEAIGIHAIFGAFLAGVALGDSPHLREHTKEIISRFANNIFTPLFFVSIGLRVDFISNFNPVLTVVLIVLAISGKIAGSFIGGRISGLEIRESLSVGSAMSACGAMGIILGLMGLEHGIIGSEVFVSIVIMAVFTTVLSAPLITLSMRPKHALNIFDLFDARFFASPVKDHTVNGVVMELAKTASKKTGIDSFIIAGKVIERETLMSTGIGEGIAVPHARIPGLKTPCLITGISPDGIDFNAPDGLPANLIFMILTSPEDQESQIQILAQISRIFSNESIKRLALQAKSYIQFISAIKISPSVKK